MLRLCLFFLKNRSLYAYKVDAYKKKECIIIKMDHFSIEPIFMRRTGTFALNFKMHEKTTLINLFLVVIYLVQTLINYMHRILIIRKLLIFQQ